MNKLSSDNYILEDARKSKDEDENLSMWILAKYGNDEDKTSLLEKYQDRTMLELIARHGNNKHRDKILSIGISTIRYYNLSWVIFAIIAQFGNDKHRNKLVGHENPNVRAKVAQFGNNKHRDKLVHDLDPGVRMEVAKYGNESHWDVLINDENDLVAGCVNEYGKGKYIEIYKQRILKRRSICECCGQEKKTK